jgi:hypothetical protein
MCARFPQLPFVSNTADIKSLSELSAYLSVFVAANPLCGIRARQINTRHFGNIGTKVALPDITHQGQLE